MHDNLTDTQYQMLLEIQNDFNIAKVKLATLIGLGKTTIDNGIAALKKYGYIQIIDSNKSEIGMCYKKHNTGYGLQGSISSVLNITFE